MEGWLTRAAKILAESRRIANGADAVVEAAPGNALQRGAIAWNAAPGAGKSADIALTDIAQ